MTRIRIWYTARLLAQVLVEMEGTLPSEHNPTGTFTPVNLVQELKVQVGTRTCRNLNGT